MRVLLALLLLVSASPALARVDYAIDLTAPEHHSGQVSIAFPRTAGAVSRRKDACLAHRAVYHPAAGQRRPRLCRQRCGRPPARLAQGRQVHLADPAAGRDAGAGQLRAVRQRAWAAHAAHRRQPRLSQRLRGVHVRGPVPRRRRLRFAQSAVRLEQRVGDALHGQASLRRHQLGRADRLANRDRHQQAFALQGRRPRL